MAITFPSQTPAFGGDGGDNTNWSVNIPNDVSGGIQAGDLIVVCAIAMEAEDNDWSPDPPTNMDGRWVNELQVGQTPASIPGISVYYKIAEGDEDGEAVSMTGDFACAHGWMAFVIRGVDTATPLDVSIQTAQSTADGDPDPPAITPANDDCMILVLGIQDALDTTTTLTSHPTNYTGIGFSSIIDGTGYASGNICAAYRILSGGGSSSENPGAWDLSITDQWAAVTIALRPAAGGQIEQEGFRFYGDGTESGSSPLAAQDTDISIAKETTFQERVLLNATGDPASSQFQLEYKESGDGAGEWRKVPTN